MEQETTGTTNHSTTMSTTMSGRGISPTNSSALMSGPGIKTNTTNT